jgi:hypothetical protein
MADGHDVSRAFFRNADGSWTCVEPVTIDHPRGRIQLTVGTLLMPGTIFMGIDLAGWLDEQAKQRYFSAK